jgi:hypothetical protein
MKYKLSFTAGSLLFPETIKVAELYSKIQDWERVEKQVINENILQKVSRTSSKRIFQEIKLRISSMTKEQFQILISTTYQNQKLLLYLAICKYYKFIFDFIVEVVRNKTLLFDYTIFDSDYVNFFEAKKEEHPKLQELSDKTAAKIKQVLFRILAEANLIDSPKSKKIIPVFLDKKIEDLIIKDNPLFLKVFLMSDKDIKQKVEKYHE